MNRYPLFFTIRENVFGNGFLAEVVAKGKAFAEEEKDGVWFYGVEPGGLAAGGKNRAEAYLEFRHTFISVIFDFAEKAKDYAQFSKRVRRFFHQVSRPTLEEWEEAVSDVRSGKVKEETLKKEPADSPAQVDVRLIVDTKQGSPLEKALLPKQNKIEPQSTLLAA